MHRSRRRSKAFSVCRRRPHALLWAALLWGCSTAADIEAAPEPGTASATPTATGSGEPAPTEAQAGRGPDTPADTPATDEGAGDPRADRAPPDTSAPEIRCVMPALPIPRPAACARGQGYPECKWKLPHALHSRHTWRRWRNTITAHQYGRPALVALLVTTARELHRLAPDQIFVIGDLDAPGPRHSTHDHGVDADLYLPGTLMVENAGGGDYVDNYAGLTPEAVEGKRQTVLLLAQILATCSGGKIRIYYNDEVVRRRFSRWFSEQGLTSPFGEPMQRHNHLHDFHFHITIPEDLPLLPSEPYDEPPPVEPIEAPPTAEEVAASNALSSRTAPHGATDEAMAPPAAPPTGDAPAPSAHDPGATPPSLEPETRSPATPHPPTVGPEPTQPPASGRGPDAPRP